MSGYNIECFIKDFGERTWENYQYIKNRASQENLYEVTQLLNSLFGLVILPVERFKDIRNIEISKEIIDMISDLENKKLLRNTYVEEKDPVMFIRHIRNAVAHAGNCGMHPYSIMDEGKKIGGVIFYDCDKDSEFCVDLTCEYLERFMDLTTKLYAEIDARYGKIKEFDQEIDLMKAFLNSGKGELSVQEEIKKIRMLSGDISELDLPIMTINCLRRAGIVTIGDLCDKTDEDLNYVRSLGKKSRVDTLNALAEKGLKLRETDNAVSDNDPNEAVDENSNVNQLIKALREGDDLGLSDEQIIILKDRFGIDDGKYKTFEEVGEKYSITPGIIQLVEILALGRVPKPSSVSK